MGRVKFGDVVKEVKINIDRTNNPYDYYVAGDHMDSEDLTIRRKGSFATDDVGPAFTRLFKPGQILYGSRRTYLKKVAVADFEGICSNTTFVLETKDESLLRQRLIPFIMLTDDFTKWSISKSKGSTNPYILFSDLANYEFELPDIARQDELVELLWQAYATKESYKKMILATDEMVKSQFIEKTSSSSSPSISLKEVVSIVRKNVNPTSGKTYTLYSFQAYDNRQIPKIVDGGEIRSCKLVLTPNTVLYNKLNVRLCRVWSIREIATTNSICSTEFIPLKMDENVLLQEYLVYFLTSEAVTKAMVGVSQGTSNSQKRIAPEALLKLEIPLPPIEVQKEFVAVYKKSDKSKFELKQAIEKIDKVMRALMQ